MAGVARARSPGVHLHKNNGRGCPSFMGMVDCEQPFFFLRFSKGSTRARERRSRETRETRAPSVTRVAICVSRVLLDGLQKKERMLVVYGHGANSF